MIVICYDVNTTTRNGARRLRRISKICLNFGVRVQYSVFECDIDAASWVKLRAELLAEYDAQEDSIRVYFVDQAGAERTEHHGVRRPISVRGPLIV